MSCTKSTIASFMLLMLMGNTVVALAEAPIEKHNYNSLVLDITVTGDSTVTGDLAENEVKIAKFSEYLRDELQQKTRFNIVKDAASLDKLAAAGENVDLHNCNGCEQKIAEELGAELVVMPTVFRMSHLISALHLEFKEVESGKLIKRKVYDFRGNTDKAWERVIQYAVRDLKSWDKSN